MFKSDFLPQIQNLVLGLESVEVRPHRLDLPFRRIPKPIMTLARLRFYLQPFQPGHLPRRLSNSHVEIIEQVRHADLSEGLTAAVLERRSHILGEVPSGSESSDSKWSFPSRSGRSLKSHFPDGITGVYLMLTVVRCGQDGSWPWLGSGGQLPLRDALLTSSTPLRRQEKPRLRYRSSRRR